MRRLSKRQDQADTSDRVRRWTRERFALGDGATIMVLEMTCTVPGCPPLETHIVFWTTLGRHHIKIFKQVADVGQGDLPPAFMKNALVALEGLDCDCC